MNNETVLLIKTILILSPVLVAVIRLLNVLPAIYSSLRHNESENIEDVVLQKSKKGSNIMILLGSGGHTGEMVRLLSKVDLTNFSRTWVTSSGDNTSILKAKAFEEDQLSDSTYKHDYISIERARRVNEPLFLSIRSTLRSFLSTIRQLFLLSQYPSILLLNGPGTSVPIAYTVFLMKYLGLCNTKIIYIESLARVNNLSLSGLLLLPISNRFLVQWEKLGYKYKRAEYYGILV